MSGMLAEQHKLLCGVRRSIRYHARRQAFYESLDRWTTFALLLLGSGAMALLLLEHPAWVLGANFVMAFLAGLRLVFGIGAKAGIHARFVSDFTRLEKRLRASASAEEVAAVTRERLELEASEPPVMRVLDVICHNELLTAEGYQDPEERVDLAWWQYHTANLCNCGEHRLQKKGAG